MIAIILIESIERAKQKIILHPGKDQDQIKNISDKIQKRSIMIRRKISKQNQARRIIKIHYGHPSRI